MTSAYSTPKQTKLLRALKRGSTPTTGEISGRYYLYNPTAAIKNLRYQGHRIRTTRTTNARGKEVVRYRLSA